MTIGDRIKEARGTKTRRQFSIEVDCTERAVMYWEKGERVPDREALEKLAKATGLSIDYLLYGDREAVA